MNRCSLRNNSRDFFGFILASEGFDLHSAVGRRMLVDSHFMTDSQCIIKEYDAMQAAADKATDVVRRALCELQDIAGTLASLENGETIDDVQLFEIKHLARITMAVRNAGFTTLPDLGRVVEILDPNREDVDTFYIYDSYSAELAAARRAMTEPSAERFAEIAKIEDDIRIRLARELMPFADSLKTALTELGMTDLRLAKMDFAKSEGLVRPAISDNRCAFTGLFNIEVRKSLSQRGLRYQPIDISFGRTLTLVTGMNMGGKSVLLKSLAMAQMLCQYGFFVPAANAEMMLFDDVLMTGGDGENAKDGLSSFAAEIRDMDYIVKAVRAGSRIFVLEDELARTTNPFEGRKIVNGMARLMAKCGVASFITTHFDGIEGDFRRIRVRGLRPDAEANGTIEGMIDYSLIETGDSDVPHEALRVARLLGADEELLEMMNN